MDAAQYTEALAKVQREVDERFKAEKDEYVGRMADFITKAEYTERMDALKTNLNSDLKKTVEDMIKLSQQDPRNRVDLIPRREFSFHRSLAKTAVTREAAMEVYKDFLTTHSDHKDVARFHQLSTRMTVLQLAARAKGNANWLPANAKMFKVRKWWHEYSELQREFFPEDFYQRAFDTTNQAIWVPEVLSADLMRYLEIRGSVLPNVRNFEMPAPIWRSPFTTAAGKAKGFSERTAAISYASGQPAYINATVYGETAPFDRATFDAGTFRGVLISTGEFVEESIVPMMAWMFEESMDSIRRAAEDTFFNGDKVSPGIDNDITYTVDNTGGVDNRTIWNGVRWHNTQQASSGILVDAQAAGGLDDSDISTARKATGRYGVEASDWLLCCSPASYLDLVDTANVLTMDKVGDRATIVTGQLGSIFGMPIVVSEYVRSDVASTGYRTTTTNNLTMIVGFHRPSYWLGNWRGITTETERVAIWNQDVVYAWYRADLQKMRKITAGSAEKTEFVIRNIPIT